jgi:hypothetical protein
VIEQAAAYSGAGDEAMTAHRLALQESMDKMATITMLPGTIVPICLEPN